MGRYLAYDTLLPNSDHWCLWVDITYTPAFGHNMPVIIKPATHRLHCKDPRLVTNYVRKYKDFIEKHRLTAKVRKLKEEASYPLDELGKYNFEEIDVLRCKGMAIAERKCRKLRMGQVAFPPQLKQASRTIKAWHLLEKKRKGMRESSRYLRRTLCKSSIPIDARGTSLDTISHKLKLAYTEYYKIKVSDKTLRSTSQEKLAEAIAQEGNQPKEKDFKGYKTQRKTKINS